MTEPVVPHHGRETGGIRLRRGAAVCLQRLVGRRSPIVLTRGRLCLFESSHDFGEGWLPAGRIPANPVSRVVPKRLFNAETLAIDLEPAKQGFGPGKEPWSERDSRADDGLDDTGDATAREQKVFDLERDNPGLFISDLGKLQGRGSPPFEPRGPKTRPKC